MSALLSVVLFSFASSCLIGRCVQHFAGRIYLLQAPNHRSSHLQPTPTGGGLGIAVVGTFLGGWLAIAHDVSLYPVLLGLPLAVVGLWDDMRHLPATLRFAVQLLVVGVALVMLRDLPPVNLAGIGEVQGWLLLVVLLLAGLWWINLFNFMDGIDGIASAQALSMLVVAAAVVVWRQHSLVGDPLWLFAIGVAAACLGFLVLNWSPARIFMGDVGSTWLSFTLFIVALLMIQRDWLSYTCWLVLAAVFITDASVTLLTRFGRGERWYEAHRSHAYQRLSRRWPGNRHAGHRAVTLLVTGINLLWLAPLSVAVLIWPDFSWAWLAAAYLPIVLGVVWLGAGRPDED